MPCSGQHPESQVQAEPEPPEEQEQAEESHQGQEHSPQRDLPERAADKLPAAGDIQPEAGDTDRLPAAEDKHILQEQPGDKLPGAEHTRQAGHNKAEQSGCQEDPSCSAYRCFQEIRRHSQHSHSAGSCGWNDRT